MKRKKTITKRTVFFKMFPVREVIIMMMGLVLVYVSTVQFPILMLYTEEFPVVPISGVMMTAYGLIVSLVRTYITVLSMIRLNVQENFLNFSFNEEMKKHQITSTRSVTAKWFIDIRRNNNYANASIVLRKDFIKTISKIREQESAAGAPARTSIIVTTCNGKKKKIWTSFTKHKDIIYDFAKWYRKGNSTHKRSEKRELDRNTTNQHITELRPKRSKYFSSGYIIALTVVSIFLYIYFFNHESFALGWQIFTGVLICLCIFSSYSWISVLVNERLYIHDDHFIYRDANRNVWHVPYGDIVDSLFQTVGDEKPFIETNMAGNDDVGYYNISDLSHLANLENAIQNYKEWSKFK